MSDPLQPDNESTTEPTEATSKRFDIIRVISLEFRSLRRKIDFANRLQTRVSRFDSVRPGACLRCKTKRTAQHLSAGRNIQASA